MEGPSRSCAVRKNPAGAGLPFDFPDRVVQQSEIGEVIEIGIEIAKAMMRTFFTWQGNIRVGQKKELRSVTSSAATPRLDPLDVCVLNVEATRFEVLRSAE